MAAVNNGTMCLVSSCWGDILVPSIALGPAFSAVSIIASFSPLTASGNQINALEPISNRGGGNDDGKLTNRCSGTYIHSPSSTSPTIKIRGKMTYGSNVYINRSGDADNATYEIRSASFLHLYELAG